MLYYKKECAAVEADRNMFSFSVPKNAMFYFFGRKKNKKKTFSVGLQCAVPSANGEVGNGVEVGTKHVSIAEHFVSESVNSVQHDSNVGGCHPLLWRHYNNASCFTKPSKRNRIAQIPLGSSRLDTTRHVRRVELVVSNVSSRAIRQTRHSQNAWVRHVGRVVSCRYVMWRDVTSQVEFGLMGLYSAIEV